MDSPGDDEDLDTDYDDYDVVIIGGGLTGMSAAYHLTKKRANLSVMIIEAEDSTGGRLKSDEHFDLHAHSFQRNITQLLRELKIQTEFGEQWDESRRVFCDEKGPVSSLPSFIAAQVYYCMKSLNESSLDQRLKYLEDSEELGRLAELSASDLIDRLILSSRAKAISRGLASLACGFVDLKNTSALWLLAVFHGAGGLFQRLKLFLTSNTRYFIKGGNSVLLQRLTEKILNESVTVNCSERVNKITFNEYRNFVVTDKKKYKCSHVIIAVSPPASAELTRESIPEDYQSSQSSYVSSRIIRFESNYRDNIWAENHSGTIIPLVSDDSHRLRLIQETTHPPGNEFKTLSGYFSSSGGGDKQSRSLELSRTLRQCLKTGDHSHVNFYEDVEIKGLMSVLQPSTIAAHMNPMRNPYKRIFFAASEYSGQWPGTADGAVEAGEHSACLVLSDIRPQSLSRSQIVTFIPARVRRPDSSFEVWMTRAVLLLVNSMIFWSFCREAYNF